MQLATSPEHDAGAAGRGGNRWLVVATAFWTIPAFALSLGILVAAALRDSDPVATRAGLRSVDLGWPLVWVHQDQSSLDPPLPSRLGLASPLEHPTHLAGAAFLGNLLIGFTVVLVVGLLMIALAVALARRSRPHP
jgi:hypothetical protein